jgi:hypothetical protein
MDCPACNPCNSCNCPDPDFIERNGTWLLGMVGILATCVGGVFTYFLKSRCSHIKFCGTECQREVVALDPKNIKIETSSSNP